MSTVALGLLCSLPLTRASAQTCVHCPDNSQGSAIGVAFSIFAIQNGQTNNVSGSTVGACNTLILVANVSYNPNATDAQGNPVVGSGFVGGTGHIFLPNGTAVDVTPANMATTLVGPAGGSGCIGAVNVKPMNNLSYTLTAADIAAGGALFTFEYTNGVFLLPDGDGVCRSKFSFSLQQTVAIAPPPTCTVTPANQVCPGGSACFTVTPTGTGPFTINWTGPNGFTAGNTNTICINNVQAANAGFYVAHVVDQFGCTTMGQTTLVVVSPRFTNLMLADSLLILSGGGGVSNGTYTVISTTNVATPLPLWVPIFTNNFDANGQFNFTNPFDPSASQRYYRLLLP